VLFPVRRTPWYIQRRPLGGGDRASQGSSYFIADNPPFGAVFTYHLAEGLKSLQERRREAEEKLEKEWKDTPYVGYDELERERRQAEPTMVLTIRNSAGEVVRRLTGPAAKGFNRVAWNLTYPTTSAIRSGPESERQDVDADDGFMAPPGTYSVALAKKVDGVVTRVAGPVEFEVYRVFEGALEGTPPVEAAAFMREVAALQLRVSAASQALALGFETVAYLEKALARATVEPGEIDSELEALKLELFEVDELLAGNRSRRDMGEAISPTISTRLRVAARTDGRTDYGPTAMHRRALEIAAKEFAVVEPELRRLLEVDLPALEEKMEAAGVPWTPGRALP
jgi:hypothetical protein